MRALGRDPEIGVLATSTKSHGGVERYSKDVIEALGHIGYRLVVAETIDWRSASRRVVGMLGLTLRLRRMQMLWVLHPRLAFAGLVLARIHRVPMVVSTYGYETWGRYSRLRGLALRRADVVTVVSKFTQAMMGRPGMDAVLLPPLPSFDAVPEIDELVPQAERKMVLFVGRFSAEYKGLGVFLRAANSVAEDSWGWEFVAAGGMSRDERAQYVSGVGPVRLVVNPPDNDLRRLYEQAAIVVFPSRTVRDTDGYWRGGEGFGITLLDAAIFGCVTITSDEGACPEVGALLGNSLSIRGSSEELSSTILCLMRDRQLREVLASQGTRNARRLFAPEEFGGRVANLVQQATDSHR
jgi:glycosyltransferase involved in cell wall biosynthesis